MLNYTEVEMLEDCVLVTKIESSNDVSDGGIVLPDRINERPVTAVVLAVGPGMKMDDGSRFPMTLKRGDIVVFPRKSGDHVLLDGGEYIIIPERYILMKIEDKEREGDYHESGH